MNGRLNRLTGNVYLDLTREFNEGALRAILGSEQAVVLHRLAVMSKDGDWILREDPDALQHVLRVLDRHGARYRFGAPLDVRWTAGGWSSHLEFRENGLRIRTDFVTRPPRLSGERLAALWAEAEPGGVSYVGARDLAEIKKTNREKDYPVIGELARLLIDPEEQLLLSRSARDLQALAQEHPQVCERLVDARPVLALADGEREDLEAALDAERRELMRLNERRLARYADAAQGWKAKWTEVAAAMEGLPLLEAHDRMVAAAEGVLPFRPQENDE